MALFQVIRFEGPPEVLVWKYPKENMNSGSQLVVGPAQTAVFVKEGRICDLFESGTYTLDTNNLPLLSALINLPFGGRSPFTAEVFYVNQRSILDIKWGTQVPIQLKDPVYQVIIPLRAFGQYGVSVEDPGLFVEKLVGAAHAYTTDDLIRYFRGLVGSRVTDELSTALTEEGISFVEASARIAELSERIAGRLQDFFAAYGIRLVSFFISSINAPENDPSVQRLKAVLSERQKMEALNYNYQQAQTYNILGRAADQLGGDGGMAGVGVGAAMGAAVADLVRQNLPSAQPAPSNGPAGRAEAPAYCVRCGSPLPTGAVFCPKCGQEVREPQSLLCGSCGSPCQLGDLFCARCGRPLAPSSGP